MSVRKQRPDADHLSGASLSDLLNLDDEENYSDELDDEDTSSAGAKRKLANFLSVSGNDLCADCGSPDPKWVSANLGVFVCIKCSGVHRSLGVHISKILSVNLDEWTEEDVDNVIQLGGNTAVNLKYEDSIPNNFRKPLPDASIDERTDFIKRKYVMQQFSNPDEHLSCPFTPAAINCSSTGVNPVVEKKYLNSMRLHNFGQAFLNTRKRKDAEKKSNSMAGMVEFVGMIKVNVVSGTNLVIRDVRSSDPYVMISLGTQSMKTRVIRSSLNPVWNEKLMLSIPHDVPPLKVNVFDKDKFSTDDFMGEAEIDIRPLVSVAKALENNGNANGPSKQLENMDEGKDKNTHVNNGTITVTDGKAKQDIALKLQNVESGELQIEIECVALTQ
ncbi:putative Arf GTPase activating protein [Helianthus annuus]|nr:putative Arf GTPase activating protein [Helianthus annuus]KAJ0597914.1 putative Arf GTPase activating protein [Helianthus annuus]KAJ0762200.1 putative Arf GTPase activating protein [Helianthus annuus]KAJ0927972.1 putative Arf GTPase activating protein [Helianthus annuus]